MKVIHKVISIISKIAGCKKPGFSISVMKKDEPDVKKVVSWILREITKKNPDEVAKFLTKWASKPAGRQVQTKSQNG